MSPLTNQQTIRSQGKSVLRWGAISTHILSCQYTFIEALQSWCGCNMKITDILSTPFITPSHRRYRGAGDIYIHNAVVSSMCSKRSRRSLGACDTLADPSRKKSSRKKSSPYLGVSLWFGDILSEKHCPICFRLHDKTFGNQKFPLYPFTVKFSFVK